MSAENRIKELGLILPKPMDTGHLPFELVRIDGTPSVSVRTCAYRA